MKKTYESEIAKYEAICEEKIAKYEAKKVKKREKLTKKYAKDPEKQKLELAVMENNWDVYIFIAKMERDEKARTLAIIYGKDDEE